MLILVFHSGSKELRFPLDIYVAHLINENVLNLFFSIGSTISCPLRSADFINNIERILTQKFQARTEQQCRDPDCKYGRVST